MRPIPRSWFGNVVVNGEHVVLGVYGGGLRTMAIESAKAINADHPFGGVSAWEVQAPSKPHVGQTFKNIGKRGYRTWPATGSTRE